MKQKVTIKPEILVALALVTVLNGCGQSKVDYNRQANVVSPQAAQAGQTNPLPGDLSPDSSAPDTTVSEPPFDETPSPTTGSQLSFPARGTRRTYPGHGLTWQNWQQAPWLVTDSRNLLTTNEIETLASLDLAAPPVIEGERVVYLKALPRTRQRCVDANNYTLNSQFNRGQIMQGFVPNTMNATPMACVPILQPIQSEVRLGLSETDGLIQVRWLGSSASKVEVNRGVQTVQMKMTSRISRGDHFVGATEAAQGDHMDFLLAATPHTGAASSCGLERTLVLNLTLNNGTIILAKLSTLTRMLSVGFLEQNIDASGQATVALPRSSGLRVRQIDLPTQIACHEQLRTRMACTRSQKTSQSNPSCAPSIVRALDINYRDLLDTGSTYDIFFRTREAAQRTTWSGNQGEDPAIYHPLSLEDNLSFADLVNLRQVN